MGSKDCPIFLLLLRHPLLHPPEACFRGCNRRDVTYAPDQKEDTSISQDEKQRPKCARYLLYADDSTVISHTEQQFQYLRDSFPKHTKTSVRPSAWKKRMCCAQMRTFYLTSQLTTMNLMSSTSQHTSGPPSATIYLSMPRSANALTLLQTSLS